MTAISIKQLLEAGVHFGHQTRRWNPKMKEYIFGERNGIYIIDLQKTLKLFKEAIDFVYDLSSQGKTILFVGTKRQAQEAIQEEAERCSLFYVNNRWLGGLLTNFTTIQNSIKRYKELENMREQGFYERLSKKEVARLERERKKLEKNLKGIKEMDRLPDAIFIVDSRKEAIAVQEARKLGIPIIAVVDTNCDPEGIDHVIPGNDDALRAVRLFASTISEAILAGRAAYQSRVDAEVKEAEERATKEAAARQAAKEAKEAARQLQKQAEAEAAASRTQTEPAGEQAAKEKPERKKKVVARRRATTAPLQAEAEARPQPEAKPEVAEPAPTEVPVSEEVAVSESEGEEKVKTES